jgi:hypothetical protein
MSLVERIGLLLAEGIGVVANLDDTLDDLDDAVGSRDVHIEHVGALNLESI